MGEDEGAALGARWKKALRVVRDALGVYVIGVKKVSGRIRVITLIKTHTHTTLITIHNHAPLVELGFLSLCIPNITI